MLCFDIGGTFTKFGIVDETGSILLNDSFPTPKKNCRVSVPDSLCRTVKELRSGHWNFNSIGISTAGQVNNRDGSIIFANQNLPDYTGCRLADIVRDETGAEVFVENDANCAVLGELWKGAGKNFSYFYCMTLGTGVGGAIVADRKLVLGAHNAAAEFGMLAGSSGILKDVPVLDRMASTKSLLDRYETLTGNSIDGRILMDKVRAGEEKAVFAWNDFLDSLACGLANITFILDPEAIIIGGGISAQGDFFFGQVNSLYQNKVMSAHKGIRIIKAELENSAGVLGAAYICVNRKYYL